MHGAAVLPAAASWPGRPHPLRSEVVAPCLEAGAARLKPLTLQANHSWATCPEAIVLCAAPLLLGVSRRQGLRRARHGSALAALRSVVPRLAAGLGPRTCVPDGADRRAIWSVACCASPVQLNGQAGADTPAPSGTGPDAGGGDGDEKTIEERFEDFTRVLPWFNFAANVLKEHSERRKRHRNEAAGLPATLQEAVAGGKSLTPALLDAISGAEGGPSLAEVVEAVLRVAEGGAAPQPAKMIDAICGRWEVVWSGALSPLAQWGLPRQCLWVQVAGGAHEPAVVTAHSGLPLLFGAYLWTSVAGELEEAEPLEAGGPTPTLLRFNRYWIDVGTNPRPDIGRVDGGLISSRLSAFGAALVTPVLFEFGALKWILERFGLQRVFEVDVPSPEGEGRTVKLEASLELYLTLLAMVAFPESLSTCPVAYLDAKAGVCVYEIPMLGPVSSLPRWLHPGGNAAALVARRLAEGETPRQMRSA